MMRMEDANPQSQDQDGRRPSVDPDQGVGMLRFRVGFLAGVTEEMGMEPSWNSFLQRRLP
jgi:hypothetical protein